MTKILALDASTDACSVALTVNGVTSHIFELAAKSHTQRLLPMVDEILSAANCSLQDLNAIAYGYNDSINQFLRNLCKTGKKLTRPRGTDLFRTLSEGIIN